MTSTKHGKGRVLHVLAQRPGLTGSGVTLDALVRRADAAGWDQWVLCGVPADEAAPAVGQLGPDRIERVTFGAAVSGVASDLPYPVVGMSDVMPYPSTRWSSLQPEELDLYRSVWRRRLAACLERIQPQVLHVHHGWMVATLAIEAAARRIPVVVHTHGTALRQMVLCPHLSEEVRRGCQAATALVVLHREHQRAYSETYGIDESRVHVVGAGYREEVFHPGDEAVRDRSAIAFAGKLSAAKGLPELLDAMEIVGRRRPAHLLVAGDGAGEEADALRHRMATTPGIAWCGRLDQVGLADLLRRCAVFVLPSYYEGLPLVLVEAAASGCRLVASSLPGLVQGLAPWLGDALTLVDLPSMASIDRPDPAGVPRYVARLAGGLASALDAGPLDHPPPGLAAFTWQAVFERIQRVWLSAMGADPR